MRINLDFQKLKLKLKIKMNIHDPDKDIGVSNFLSKNFIWEPFETSIFLKLISKKNFFIDIGANIGYYSLIASNLISKSGKVIAFEPEKSNLKILYENLKINKAFNVDVIEKACSDRNQEAYLELSKDNLGDHRLSYKESSGSSNLEIETTTVDMVTKKYSLIPDIVKIDTQGAELKIIKGMKSLLCESNFKTIFFIEFWPYGIEKQGNKINELIKIISLKSYKMLAIFEENELQIEVKDIVLRRWSKTIMNFNSLRYTNLIFAHKDNISFSKYLSSLKNNKFKFNQINKSVINNTISKLLVPVGWSFPESDGVWSDGLYSEIFLNNLVFKKDRDYRLILKLIPILNSKIPKITMKVSVNNRFIGSVILEDAYRFNDFSIKIPKKVILQKFESFAISLQFTSGVTPSEFSKSNDKRLLSAKINSFMITEK